MASLFGRWLPVRGGKPGSQGLSSGPKKRFPLDEGGLDPAEVLETGPTSVNRGPSPSGAPARFPPAFGGFPRVMAVSSGCPGFLPRTSVGGEPVKEEFFPPGIFRSGNTPPC
ncbi:hypothetical protein GWK47_019521 [Chionoecetes opilio]|uniref:Uncharacterized protein n=1 Tax=Chionoecetes opilio TaxID=41210 RepID=A0A8J4XQ71_CHIOP|nr:hypothetical protein GWK47_019521 [Chionoecetes opilio]